MKSEFAEYSDIPENNFDYLDSHIDALSETLRKLKDKYQKTKEQNRISRLAKIQEEINDAREMIETVIDEL